MNIIYPKNPKRITRVQELFDDVLSIQTIINEDVEKYKRSDEKAFKIMEMICREGHLPSLDDLTRRAMSKFTDEEKASTEKLIEQSRKWGVSRERLQEAIKDLAARRFIIMKLRQYVHISMKRFGPGAKGLSEKTEADRRRVEAGGMKIEKADELLKERVATAATKLRQANIGLKNKDIFEICVNLDESRSCWISEDPGLGDILQMNILVE
ncbi:hypothetical protein AMATHDRAFT_59724 [Amanita thiersii Skay4041]|uniref:Uncharacterized protein n=1 Tax=Amanita thiersii Skay4041 TaxID=703135 RepID=A0A2A9NU40_9AGAR|nr:hypothetical protein AMATHDRAFT_59724 [Amanita thiersii Skay4041]